MHDKNNKVSIKDILSPQSPVKESLSPLKSTLSLKERFKIIDELFENYHLNYKEFIQSLEVEKNPIVVLMDTNGFYLYKSPILVKITQESDEECILQSRAVEFFSQNPDSALKEVYDIVFRDFPEVLEGKGTIP
jgi:hypothetical protein